MASSSSPVKSQNTQTKTSNIIKRKGGNTPNGRSTTQLVEWTTEAESELSPYNNNEMTTAAEDTPLVLAVGNRSDVDIESGLEPGQLKPIKDGNMKETIVGVLAAMTGEYNVRSIKFRQKLISTLAKCFLFVFFHIHLLT